MRGSRAGISAATVLLIAGITACSDGNAEGPDGPPERDLDPTPEALDGSPSTEFEPEDIERAETAGWLVEYYCDDIDSQAQYIGCLAHTTEEEICERDTAAKNEAVEDVDFVEDPCDRDRYEAGKP